MDGCCLSHLRGSSVSLLDRKEASEIDKRRAKQPTTAQESRGGKTHTKKYIALGAGIVA